MVEAYSQHCTDVCPDGFRKYLKERLSVEVVSWLKLDSEISPKRIRSVNYTIEVFAIGAVIQSRLWDFSSLVHEWCRRKFFFLYFVYICV